MLMISCKKAAELTCESLDRPLTLWEAIQLRFHLFMCAACKAFAAQNEALLRLFGQRFQQLEAAEIDAKINALPDDACERLKRKLREAAEKDNPSGR